MRVCSGAAGQNCGILPPSVIGLQEQIYDPGPSETFLVASAVEPENLPFRRRDPFTTFISYPVSLRGQADRRSITLNSLPKSSQLTDSHVHSFRICSMPKLAID